MGKARRNGVVNHTYDSRPRPPVPVLFIPGFLPIARVTILFTGKTISGKLFGAALLTILLLIHMEKIKQHINLRPQGPSG